MISRLLARALPEPMVTRLVGLRNRGKARATDNVGYNRELWDWYADRWKDDPRFRRDEADVLDPSMSDEERFAVLGNEWGTSAEVDRVVADFIEPFVTPESVAGEIGVGGGRVAAKVVDLVGELWGFDISAGMLERAREHLGERPGIHFELLDGARLPEHASQRFDFLYSFDVFVHLDLHTIWKYLNEVARALRPGGRAFLHTSNLTAPTGWANFARQERYRPQDHYFVTPEVIHTLVSHTDLSFVKESTPEPDSFYLSRDYLFVLEKPA
jgi:SAM-dependent methyltransferase